MTLRELIYKLIDRHSEFLVEFIAVLSVYIGVALILGHYNMEVDLAHWLTGGVIITTIVQVFRARLGVDNSKEVSTKTETSVVETKETK